MPSIDLTPTERLANSRKAIVRHMKRDTEPDPERHRLMGNKVSRGPDSGSTWREMKNAIIKWWSYHPAHAALELAGPAVGKYAGEKPFKLLAVAAVFGAACVVLRPWRLVSPGGVALATLKSSEFSGLLLSMMSKAGSKPSSDSNPV